MHQQGPGTSPAAEKPPQALRDVIAEDQFPHDHPKVVQQSMSLPVYLTPVNLIAAASRAHRAFRFASAVAGIAGIVIILSRYGTSYATLAFGSILAVVMMVIFLVFSQATAISRAHLTLPAAVLVWSFLIICVATALLLFTSAFFNAPLPLRATIIREIESQEPQAASTPAMRLRGPPPAAVPHPYTPAHAPQTEVTSTEGAALATPVQSSISRGEPKSDSQHVASSSVSKELAVVIQLTWDQGVGSTPRINMSSEYRCGRWIESPVPTEASADAVPGWFAKTRRCSRHVSSSGEDVFDFDAAKGAVHASVATELEGVKIGEATAGWMKQGERQSLHVHWQID